MLLYIYSYSCGANFLCIPSYIEGEIEVTMPFNLLIADNSPTIHKVVGLAFEGEDVAVHTAGNGQEALDKANETLPDIIFADTGMPEINGFDLCQKIKKDDKLKNIPVCLIHSDFEEFDEEKYRACGADNHLPKPFKSKDIVSKVAEITGEAGKENMESEKKPDQDIDELEILPLDEVEEETKVDEAIELILEDAIDEPTEDKNASTVNESNHEPSEDEITDFMEDIGSENELEKELEEFNDALDIPDDELGEAEPYTEEEKTEISPKPELPENLEIEVPEQKEKEKPVETEEIDPELELEGEDIKEEKEDLIEDTGILPASEMVTAKAEKTVISKPTEGKSQIAKDDFEKLIDGYIKQEIEKILKDAIQSEISTITDKIIDAVERIAREITPDISKTIIKKEIEKIKDPEA